MSDLTDEQLELVSRLRAAPPWATRFEEFDDIESMTAEIRRRRSAPTVSGIMDLVREAFSAHEDLAGHPATESVARRLASRLSAPAPLSPADLTILKRLRDNEERARNSIGHLGDDVRRGCEAAVELLTRLLGAAP